jgi:pimeloyl-ACP methyl ester carboxylesterase
MEYFYFGRRSLFGSYSASPPATRPASVVVLCYPFGQEYMRAHRAYRQIATLVHRFGLPVLRFDYFGTGDSPGRGDEATLDSWVEDVTAAVSEARRRSGLPHVRMMGLRLGASAALLATQGREDVERVVLWDPVVRGSAWLEEISDNGAGRTGSTWWMHGFPLSPEFRGSVEKLDLRQLSAPVGSRVFQMISHPTHDFEAFSHALRCRSVREETRIIPSPSDWNYSDDVGGILLPREMVRGIVDVLVEP